tara:strand:- start:1963 stop:2136 length:174 start_codon:yes stop_codon:yes gene_type:complete
MRKFTFPLTCGGCRRKNFVNNFFLLRGIILFVYFVINLFARDKKNPRLREGVSGFLA